MLQEDNEENLDFKAIVTKYIVHWKWFLVSVLVCVTIAYIYLRYAPTQFQASTTILVKDEKRGGISSELSAFADMGLGTGLKNNVDNEIEILKSRVLAENTVKKLQLNVSIISHGKVVATDLYSKAPIAIRFLSKTPEFYIQSASWTFKPMTSNTFELKAVEDDVVKEPVLLTKNTLFEYGKPIQSKLGVFMVYVLEPNGLQAMSEESILTIDIRSLKNVADSFRKRLKVSPLSKTSSVVELSLVDPIQKKAEDYLDNLISIYNDNAVSDKNTISLKTSEFINKRLALITEELDGVEKDVERFKTANDLTDIESQAKLFVEGSGEYNKKSLEAAIQWNIVVSMLDFLKTSAPSDLLPATLIPNEAEASSLIASYNELVLRRNRLVKSASAANPTIIALDQQIASLKANVQSSLQRLKATLNIQKQNLVANEGVFNQKINKIPLQERQFRVIARQQKVKEELYLYLLKKREETALSLSATEANARVIDNALASDTPVSPKKSILYLAAMLIGLLIPFVIIYLHDLLDTKIKSRLDLEGKTNMPFIGDLPTSLTPHELMQIQSRSSTAEALRIIRTNLEFMFASVFGTGAKTIFLTSTFPKEGKTFVSVNLAATFAFSKKRVVLVGLDIRNPRIDDYINLPSKGVTNYLASDTLELKDLIYKHPDYDSFYILPAGVIPPNPAELLMSNKVNLLFEQLKKDFDYVIVDTAPVSLITDTLIIAHHADCFVYVARANFLDKQMLQIPNQLNKEKKLPNMCLLLNDTDSTKGYGYGYGYGVNQVKEVTWSDKIFNKFKNFKR
ncbi:GumC family protein [Flavobacterium sp. RSSB_23]|uniref:GumC family protein n=1 Tax=Flavobacterium sp. RSSB_23 TaxID=3447668 RepID=UPI003F36F9DF